MKKVFYVIVDEDGHFVDEDCFYYDKVEKKPVCNNYLDYKNYISLGQTKGISESMMEHIESFCQRYNIHRSFAVKEVNV